MKIHSTTQEVFLISDVDKERQFSYQKPKWKRGENVPSREAFEQISDTMMKSN